VRYGFLLVVYSDLIGLHGTVVELYYVRKTTTFRPNNRKNKIKTMKKKKKFLAYSMSVSMSMSINYF